MYEAAADRDVEARHGGGGATSRPATSTHGSDHRRKRPATSREPRQRRRTAEAPRRTGATQMARRIAFINPFGTDAYDEIIMETLGPLALGRHRAGGDEPDRRAREHRLLLAETLLEVAVFNEVMRLEQEGFDAVIVGMLLRPRRARRPRARRHPRRRAARSRAQHVELHVAPADDRHRSPQGRAVHRGLGAALRTAERARRPKHRLVGAPDGALPGRRRPRRRGRMRARRSSRTTPTS